MAGFFYSEAGLATLVSVMLAVATVVVAIYQSRKDAWEREQVVPHAERRVALHVGDGKNHEVIVAVTNTGNRPTVIRDVRLVDRDGRTFVSLRGAERGRPELPVRLDAHDERVVRIEVTPDEQLKGHGIEVDLLDDDEPKRLDWPFVHLRGSTATATGGAVGIVPDAVKSTDEVKAWITPAPPPDVNRK